LGGVGVGLVGSACQNATQLPPPSSDDQRASENAAVIAQPQDEAGLNALFSLDENSYVVLPDDWESDRELHETADIQASNRAEDLYLIVLVEEKPESAAAPSATLQTVLPEPAMSLAEYSDRALALLSGRLNEIEIDGPTSTRQIQDYPAQQFILRGQLDGIEGVYLLTVVETTNAYYQLLAWSIPDQFSEHQDHLQQVVQSFREIPRSRPTQQRPRPVPQLPIETDPDDPSADSGDDPGGDPATAESEPDTNTEAEDGLPDDLEAPTEDAPDATDNEAAETERTDSPEEPASESSEPNSPQEDESTNTEPAIAPDS